MVYEWRKGSRYSVPAQKVGEELGKIEKKYGSITTQKVVDAARNPKNPLHECGFDWDKDEAAEKWLNAQAAALIRSVVAVVPHQKSNHPIRAMVAVRHDGSGYVSTARALSDVEMRQMVLARALREMELWKERYIELEELVDIFAAIDEVTKKAS